MLSVVVDWSYSGSVVNSYIFPLLRMTSCYISYNGPRDSVTLLQQLRCNVVCGVTPPLRCIGCVLFYRRQRQTIEEFFVQGVSGQTMHCANFPLLRTFLLLCCFPTQTHFCFSGTTIYLFTSKKTRITLFLSCPGCSANCWTPLWIRSNRTDPFQPGGS